VTPREQLEALVETLPENGWYRRASLLALERDNAVAIDNLLWQIDQHRRRTAPPEGRP
jgi:hypothetical protein